MNISIEEMPREIDRLLEENERLQEDLDYSNYCNEELRKKITNLEYKIKLLEEDNTEERALYHSEREVKEEYKDRIDKAIKYIEDTSYKSYFSMLQADYNMSLDTLIDILKGSE